MNKEESNKLQIPLLASLSAYSLISLIFRDKLGDTGRLAGYVFLMICSVVTAYIEAYKHTKMLENSKFLRNFMSIATSVVYLGILLLLYVVLPLVIYFGYNLFAEPSLRINSLSTAFIINLVCLALTSFIHNKIVISISIK